MRHSRLLLATVCLTLLALSCPADEIYVPDNSPTTGGCNNYPFNPTLGGGDWRYQIYMPASYFGGKAFLITDVAFAPCTASVLTATTFEMRLSHNVLTTPVSTYATNLPNPVTVIPAGPITWNRTANQWNPLKLTTPFLYNGNDNLTLEVRYKGGSGTKGTDHQNANASQGLYRIYAYGTGSYSNTTGRNPDPVGVIKVRFTVQVTQIQGSGNPKIGGTVNLDLLAPADGGLPYQVGTSLGTGPIPFGNRTLNLSLDALLDASVNGYLPMFFKNYSGFLDASGKARADIVIPNIAALVGVRLHSAFVTLKAGEPWGIKSISNTFTFSIMQ
jgi:hypothetical protein